MMHFRPFTAPKPHTLPATQWALFFADSGSLVVPAPIEQRRIGKSQPEPGKIAARFDAAAFRVAF